MKFSVRYKFAIGLLFIFCLCFNLMTVFINNIVMKNNEQVINSELIASQRDLDIYFKQFVIINDMTASQEDFEKNSSKIGSALSSKLNNRIVLYKKDGSLIFDTDHSDGNMYSDVGTVIKDDFRELELAVEGQSAYKIVKTNHTYKVIFSEPLCADKTTVGILRYTKDYTQLFDTGNDLMLKIKIFMLFMFLILFIFSFLLSTKIIIPIIKLNRSTKEISNGNFNVDVLVESNDEIGELGESFNIMKGKIKEQIETIEKDRDDLIKLEGHRKVFYDNVTHEMKTPLTLYNVKENSSKKLTVIKKDDKSWASNSASFYSEDGQDIYFTGGKYKDNDRDSNYVQHGIFKINSNSGKIEEVLVLPYNDEQETDPSKDSYILFDDYSLLDGGKKIILNATIEWEAGTYIYDVDSKKFYNVIQHTVKGGQRPYYDPIWVSPDKTKVVYVNRVLEDNKIQLNLYVAKITGNSLTSKICIYKDIKFSDGINNSVKWSGDSKKILFFTGSEEIEKNDFSFMNKNMVNIITFK